MDLQASPARNSPPTPFAGTLLETGQGANALSGTGTHRHRTTMIGMIQHQLSQGLREL